jgi:hypothetical protein
MEMLRYGSACGKQRGNSLGRHSLSGCTKKIAPRLHTALLAAHVCLVVALLFCFTICQPWAFHPETLLLVRMWQTLMHLTWVFPLLPRQNI